MRRLPLTLAILLAAASAQPSSAQSPRGLPRAPMPDLPPPQERERAEQPPFRTAVTRVEVSALVLDANGNPCAA